MNEKMKLNLKQACIIGVLVLVAHIIIVNLIISPITSLLMRGGLAYTRLLVLFFALIRNAGAMAVALLVYGKFIKKAKLPTVPTIIAIAIYFAVRYLLGGTAQTLTYVLCFVIGGVVAFGYLHLAKINEVEPELVEPTAPQAQPVYTQTYVQPQAAQPEDMSGLSAAILNAIRPQLKAPMTAVLCEQEQMVITNNNGEYDIRGFVNSQNSYGALIATDFAVKARYYNGSWVISSVSVGKLAAKNYAKSFVSNYIAISIFVAVMGALGYFILKLAFGF